MKKRLFFIGVNELTQSSSHMFLRPKDLKHLKSFGELDIYSYRDYMAKSTDPLFSVFFVYLPDVQNDFWDIWLVSFFILSSNSWSKFTLETLYIQLFSYVKKGTFFGFFAISRPNRVQIRKWAHPRMRLSLTHKSRIRSSKSDPKWPRYLKNAHFFTIVIARPFWVRFWRYAPSRKSFDSIYQFRTSKSYLEKLFVAM